MEESVANVPDPNSKTNIWIIVLVGVIVIFLTLITFLYFQTKKTSTSIPNTTATNISSDLVNNEPGPNDPSPEPLYTFDCPVNSTPTFDVNGGDGITKPFVQVTCIDKANPDNKARIYTMAAGAKEISEPGFNFIKSFEAESGKNKVFISGNNQNFFDQVVASFKFSQ